MTSWTAKEQSDAHHEVIVALDIGTSATKAVAFTRSGVQVALARANNTLDHPQPDYAIQDPRALLATVELVLREIGDQIAKAGFRFAHLSLSATMHGLLVFGSDGQPLISLMTWADGRASEEADTLRRSFGHRLYRATAVPTHAMTPFAKLLWLCKHEPEVWQRAVHVGSFKEWLLWQWTGQWVVDEATAAATGLFNVQTRDWDDEWLAYAQVQRSHLSTCLPATAQLAVIDSPLAQRCGFGPGLVITIGSTDGVLANLGTVGLDPRLLAVTAGTSAAVRQTVASPLLDPSARTFCYPLVGDYWVAGGATNAGAMVLTQVAKWLAVKDVVELLALAQEAPPGSAGALFAPWLAGERAPMYDARARGGFIGLSMEHDRRHLARAAVEGVALSLRSIAQALQTDTLTHMVTSGGLAQSPFWRQVLADVFRLPVRAAKEEEASCLGAFLLATRVTNEDNWPALETLMASNKTSDEVLPDPLRSQVYDERYETFQTLYRRLHDPV
ncbi:MAG: gluconokinase [Firmicutes bacterium]|nr:gluconokinase [Bacillota bacterium]